MLAVIRIRSAILDEMLRHARSDPRVECCGLLAGRDGVITTIYPATNVVENAAAAYEIPPRELFELFRRMRVEGLDHLGIYHSHPKGDNAPSPSDIAQSLYPDAAYFIISPQLNVARAIRAFSIREGTVTEQKIKITDAL